MTHFTEYLYMLRGRFYHYLLSGDTETEAQRAQVTSPRSHSQEVAEPGFDPRHVWLPSSGPYEL